METFDGLGRQHNAAAEAPQPFEEGGGVGQAQSGGSIVANGDVIGDRCPGTQPR